jgi:TolB protein
VSLLRSVAWLGAALSLAALAPPIEAQPREVSIDIRSAGGRRIRVHLEGFEASGGAARDVRLLADQVLADDLTWSAVFTVSRAWVSGEQPFDVQAMIGGKLSVNGGQVKLVGEIRDFPAKRSIAVHEYRGPVAQLRKLVHRFADDVVFQFTGEPGVAQTRIAYVAEQEGAKELWVMDYDGANRTPLTADRSIALSPGWSPEGSLILFTSFRGGRSAQIFVVSSSGGRSFLVSGRPGNNIAASYSPDGRGIVCSLSQDGNSEIYRLDARGTNPVRLTNHPGIDTSPCWAPTGREIAFTSDRTGAPQVYLMDSEGGSLRRLTYDLGYTDSPSWSPKGDRLALVARTGGGFEIYVCRPDGADLRLVASGGNNENPRWSPDGRHLVFSSDREGTRALYVSDLDGAPPRRLDTGSAAVRTPAWGPRPASLDSAFRLDSSTPSPGR